MTCTLPVAVALTVALVPSLAPLSMHPPNVPAAVPFSVYDGGAIVVPVSIAGAGPYRFLLDTGSTRTAITARLARKLRSPVMAQTALVTPAGGGTRNVTLVPALQIGNSRPVSVAAMVIPDDALPRAMRVEGLLGQEHPREQELHHRLSTPRVGLARRGHRPRAWAPVAAHLGQRTAVRLALEPARLAGAGGAGCRFRRGHYRSLRLSWECGAVRRANRDRRAQNVCRAPAGTAYLARGAGPR